MGITKKLKKDMKNMKNKDDTTLRIDVYNGMDNEDPFVIIDEIGISFIKADMYQIVRDYLKIKKAHNKFDEILEKIICIYTYANPNIKNMLSYHKYIMPIIEKHKQFPLITCIYFSSLLSSYLTAEANSGYLNQLTKNGVFIEKDFIAWKKEIQAHTHKLIVECLKHTINKKVTRLEKIRNKNERNARKIKGFAELNQKIKTIRKIYEDISNKSIIDGWVDKECLTDSNYEYHDSVYHYKCFDDLLDLTYIILADERHKYNQNENEIKLNEISSIISSLPKNIKYQKLNENSKHIAIIHTDLIGYFKNYLMTLKNNLTKSTDDAMETAIDFIALFNKKCLEISDESVVALIREVEIIVNRYTNEISAEHKKYYLENEENK